MKRVTPRTPNPNKVLYQQYANSQFTLDEILIEFKDYTIYSVMDNASIYIVDGNKSILLFDIIGYEDDECVPDIYEAFPNPLGEDFDRTANCYLEDGCKITKLN